jgi:hypothetical protein
MKGAFLVAPETFSLLKSVFHFTCFLKFFLYDFKEAIQKNSFS